MEFGYGIWTWPGMVTQSPFLKYINKNRFPDPDKRFLVSQKGIFFAEYISLRKGFYDIRIQMTCYTRFASLSIPNFNIERSQ